MHFVAELSENIEWTNSSKRMKLVVLLTEKPKKSPIKFLSRFQNLHLTVPDSDTNSGYSIVYPEDGKKHDSSQMFRINFIHANLFGEKIYKGFMTSKQVEILMRKHRMLYSLSSPDIHTLPPPKVIRLRAYQPRLKQLLVKMYVCWISFLMHLNKLANVGCCPQEQLSTNILHVLTYLQWKSESID